MEEPLAACLEGAKAHMEVLALQDFLQSIPYMLLMNRLYKDWMTSKQKTTRRRWKG